MKKLRTDWRTVQGVKTHALVQGEGPPIVLVPGMGCSHIYYEPLQAALSEHYEVWAYDPPGLGFTKAPPNQYRTLRDISNHLSDWLEDIGLGPCALFGHSLGGEVSLDLTARFPKKVSKLILCAPTGIPDRPNLTAQMWHLVRNSFRETHRLRVRATRSYFMAGFRRVQSHLINQLDHPTEPILSYVTVPTLVIVGTRDPIIRPRMGAALAEQLPSAKLIRVEGGTHALHDSHTPQVAQAVIDFLQGEIKV